MNKESLKTSPKKFINCETFTADNRESYLIVVGGTYYDIGFLLGKTLGKLFVEELVSTYISLRRKIALFLKKEKTIDKDIEKAPEAFLPFFPSECKEELLGFYEGCKEAGHPLPDNQILEKFTVLIEIGEQECTLFAAQPPFSKTNTFQMRDLDYYKNFNMRYIPTAVIRIPQDEQGSSIDYPYASFDFISNLPGGVLTGINEHGVVISQSRAPFPTRFSFKGIPLKPLIQQVLSKARTALEAIEIIKQTPPATAHFVIISDPLQTKDSLQLVFMGPSLLESYRYDQMPNLDLIQYPKDIVFYRPIDGLVYWTDMVDRRIDNLPKDLFMKDFYNLIDKYKSDFQKEQGIEVAKKVGNDITFITALFNSSERKAWVAYSLRKTAAYKNEFIEFDLKKYFAMK
ncbi:hypothetical protein ACNVED_15000 (plasmid) [Legionella sp. D16C41]|uniref:hypothetical protein n=1 Tax=Legionella sp. D16C41 TaxID=3402688 RepID=UPI003AF4C8B8